MMFRVLTDPQESGHELEPERSDSHSNELEAAKLASQCARRVERVRSYRAFF